ncbi:MAG: glycosyltransferase, partial [Planctomycetes bacterium]|nr:glycosyltransferase [Planctomycetota bacterium]
KLFGREDMTWWDADEEREVDVVKGCFMLVRREAIKDVGEMDESLFLYGEETDWCYRFKQAGWQILFMHSAEIIHVGGASINHLGAKAKLQLWGSKLLFLKKHRGLFAYAMGMSSVNYNFPSATIISSLQL